MRMFNSDGLEAEMCGNALRCVAKLAADTGLAKSAQISVVTKSGTRHAEQGSQNFGPSMSF